MLFAGIGGTESGLGMALAVDPKGWNAGEVLAEVELIEIVEFTLVVLLLPTGALGIHLSVIFVKFGVLIHQFQCHVINIV